MEFWQRSEQREFLWGDGKVSKRQLKASELPFDPTRIILGDERLMNENKTLHFIRENTTIPVPEVLNFERDRNDSLVLITKVIDGKVLADFEDEELDTAIKAVDEQMERHIIPELHKLRSNSIGSVEPGLPLMPPNTVMYWTTRDDWRRITSEEPTFVFCHNDLSRNNIFLNPETYEIVAIIDWEYAGFFPDWFERKLWRSEPWTRTREEMDAFLKAAGGFITDGKPVSSMFSD
jgi:hypothetical protein